MEVTGRDRTAVGLTLAAWAVAVAVMGLILFGPYVAFAYRSPSARWVTETVVLCVALLGSYLTYGRFLRSHRLQDVLLAQALIVLAAATTPVSTVAARVLHEVPGATDVWLSVILQACGAGLLFNASAVGPERRVRRVTVAKARWLTPLVPLVLASVALVALGVVETRLTLAVDPDFERAEVRPELLTAHPFLVGLQLLSGFCFLSASTIWTAQARRGGDPLVRWLGPACVLGGFARALFALTPSLYTDWFYVADLLRLGLYLLLLVGLAKELAHYWTARTAAAVLEDRRRLAGELHDGVVQELSYIRSESHRIDDDPQLQERIVGATDRALDEARAAIQALTRLDGEPLVASLERAARELGRRHDVVVEVEADPDVEVDQHQLHNLLRIVREAVTNAARHGRAGLVRIELAGNRPGQRVLRVRDDGSGFEPEVVARSVSGYGLVSMAERARSLPGTLVVDSEVGAGSEVRVTW